MFEIEKNKLWNNTKAISPIIATILVLSVAVAAGVGLYFWFDTFQESAQEQVGNSTDLQFDVLKSSTIPMVVTIETTQNVPYVSATYDKKDGYDEKGLISYTGYTSSSPYYTGISYNDSNTTVYEDERFVLEIPIQFKANAKLHDVKIKVDLDNRKVTESYYAGGSMPNLGFSPYCIHLDRSNGYALQYYDSTSSSWKKFVGELLPNSDAITFDDAGYAYKFDGSKPTLNLSDFMTVTVPVDYDLGSAENDNGIYNVSNLDTVTYPDRQTDLGSYYSGDNGVFMFTGKIITAEGKEKHARKVTVDGTETPWVTASTLFNSKHASNSDAQDAYLISNTYPVGDFNAGDIKTAYVYIYVNWARFDPDTGRVVATVPIEFSSADGFSSLETVTFTLYEGSMA
ncbi:MAG TPA: hypothetical protein C5S50_10260 [Methanosarcinaceae archaeon]|nr:hypothetical protein [Methanosarcinaceae archaeon]